MANAPDPQYVLDLAGKLVEAKRNVASLEKQWADLFGSSHATDSTPSIAEVESVPDESGITARFLQFLEANKHGAFSVQAIALAIGAEPMQIHRAINRLLPKGKIKRAGRGAYTAPDSEIADAA